MRDFAENRYKCNYPHATDEANTRSFLIGPYLSELLGIDLWNPRQLTPELAAKGGFRTGTVDYALMRKGTPWCLIEAKKLYELDGNYRTAEQHWEQLSFYAHCFAEANYFALTDGRWWYWYRRDAGQVLPKKPFLFHDVSKPTEVPLSWLQAVRANLPMAQLVRASDVACAAQAARHWLQHLKDPDEATLKLVLKSSGFSASKSSVSTLRSIWKTALDHNLGTVSGDGNGKEPPPTQPLPPQPPPSPPAHPAWRLGGQAWNECKTAKLVMHQVVLALADQYPAGQRACYEVLSQAYPKYVNSHPGFSPREGLVLSHGYVLETHFDNKRKVLLLNRFVRLFQERAGHDPQVEFHMPTKPKRP